MNSDLLDLPWQLQVALASGYAGYFVANVGRRSHHQPIDIAFGTLLFGLIAMGLYRLTSNCLGEIFSAVLAILASMTAGASWRTFGKKWLYFVLRKVNVTFSNDDQSAFTTLTETTTHNLSQIAVLLTNGDWLRCDDAANFGSSLHGPCLLGPSGDVAMYLTHIEPKGRRPKKVKTLNDPHYGERITYIPSNQIARITLRYANRV